MADDNKGLLALAVAAGAGLVGWALTRKPAEARTPTAPTAPSTLSKTPLAPLPTPPSGVPSAPVASLQVTGHIVRPPDIFGADPQHQVALGASFNMMLPIDVTTNQRTQLTVTYIDAAAGSAIFGLGGGVLARRQQTIVLEVGRNTPLVPSPAFSAQSPGGHNVGAILTLPDGREIDRGNWDGVFSVSTNAAPPQASVPTPTPTPPPVVGLTVPVLVSTPRVGGNAVLAAADRSHAAVLLAGGAFQIVQTVANQSATGGNFRVGFYVYADSQLINFVTAQNVGIGPQGRVDVTSPVLFAEGPSGAAPVARDVRIIVNADDGPSVVQPFYGVFYVQDQAYVPPSISPSPLQGVLYTTVAAPTEDDAVNTWKLAHPADTFASVAPTANPLVWEIGYYPALGPPPPLV